ncbi:AAA family ATPase [Acinetobacter chinensis]|uniref:AAA family ATPase n=1 Tax=Acinetobacter chinensis TaxID=2004650 RepID=A0ABU3WAH8_9GAMM|nr:AAA family ATPase [Acinetobacter chinensis]MDV2467402.1 AAA family ATPase [Acinetobacter chinensis]
MTEKLYYWADKLEDYSSDNEKENEFDKIIEIKRLNFFIGKNNAGKSRFLRNLFMNQTNINAYTTHPLKITLDEILSIDIKNCTRTVKPRDNRSYYSSEDRIQTSNEDIPFIKDYFEIINTQKFNQEKYATAITNFMIEIESYKNHNNEVIYRQFYDELFKARTPIKNNDFQSQYYIPILRGMRILDVINKSDLRKYHFVWRTIEDYFDIYDHDKSLKLSKKILTGEDFYENLTKFRNGQEYEWQILEDYQNALSSYFFNNERVVIIPIHDNNIPHIKIGNEPQFPISQLGDGLQQVIILTYEAFTKNDKTHAFFIEEPELHMHAGMVRQLMNFYLNETNHYYFFTTHSNHLLDMADESDQVIIQKFVKQPKENSGDGFDFKIYRCDRDRDLLASLGVKPSSVYLANCTIWVEGITDRLYIIKYMEKYLAELKNSDEGLYKKYRRFMPNYHYTFVEYAGSNLTHWSFSDDYADNLDDKGLSAKAVASEMLLIADGDIKEKADRVKKLTTELKSSNFFKFECKEIENTLPKNSIIRVAKQRFKRMKNNTKQGFSIEKLDTISRDNHFEHNNFGIGKLLDNQIRNPRTNSEKLAFADSEGVGTIKNKLDFCREIIKDFDENPDWQLTPKAKELCKRIFQHIEKCN